MPEFSYERRVTETIVLSSIIFDENSSDVVMYVGIKFNYLAHINFTITFLTIRITTRMYVPRV